MYSYSNTAIVKMSSEKKIQKHVGKDRYFQSFTRKRQKKECEDFQLCPSDNNVV